MISSLRLLALVGPLLAIPAWSQPALAAGDGATVLAFAVLRDGQPFGRHVITIRRDGDTAQVDNEGNASVWLGPFALFRYAYKSREIWNGDRLVSITAWTDDDGKETTVRAEHSPDGLKVSGPGGERVFSPDTRPTSFWTLAVVGSTSLLDTQTGELSRVRVERLPVAPAAPDGAAERVRLTGDLETDLWFDRQGLLLKARFQARGAVFDYVKDERPAPVPTYLTGDGPSERGGS